LILLELELDEDDVEEIEHDETRHDEHHEREDGVEPALCSGEREKRENQDEGRERGGERKV
jgi:hypothetical protein